MLKRDGFIREEVWPQRSQLAYFVHLLDSRDRNRPRPSIKSVQLSDSIRMVLPWPGVGWPRGSSALLLVWRYVETPIVTVQRVCDGGYNVSSIAVE